MQHPWPLGGGQPFEEPLDRPLRVVQRRVPRAAKASASRCREMSRGGSYVVSTPCSAPTRNAPPASW
ncbi:hypothetical protein [[Actinomadura] parvosata]|uniref:hypothetical protein n=1 Tax=[Actinomadura] parvosata TaxID=1955412 RepID=UPI0016462C76